MARQEVPYIVLRPAPGCRLPAGCDGLWLAFNRLWGAPLLPGELSPARGRPTGWFEFRPDGARAEIYEVDWPAAA